MELESRPHTLDIVVISWVIIWFSRCSVHVKPDDETDFRVFERNCKLVGNVISGHNDDDNDDDVFIGRCVVRPRYCRPDRAVWHGNQIPISA